METALALYAGIILAAILFLGLPELIRRWKKKKVVK